MHSLKSPGESKRQFANFIGQLEQAAQQGIQNILGQKIADILVSENFKELIKSEPVIGRPIKKEMKFEKCIK